MMNNGTNVPPSEIGINGYRMIRYQSKHMMEL